MITVPAEFPTGSKAKIAFVGEAPGEEEIERGRPLIGPSGREFNRWLRAAGIKREECLITNVFDFKLQGNSVKSICHSGDKSFTVREENDIKGYTKWMNKSIEPGKYLWPDYLYCLKRLKKEIKKTKPTLIVPLGGTALWAICCTSGITALRGTCMESTLMPGVKALPTFHPAYIFQQYKQRAVAITDIIKAKAESEFKEIRVPKRKLWVNPTLNDLNDFGESLLYNAPLISVDIETYPTAELITSIAFAGDPYHSLCVPFVVPGMPDASYWEPDDEAIAWSWVRDILEGDNPKLLQNGPYDIQWLYEQQGIKTVNYLHDTRLIHHALYPELKKSLGFLGSLYANEAAWKTYNPSAKSKRDE